MAADHSKLSATAALVRNHLSVIAMFVLLVEAIATITLINVSHVSQIAVPLVWFVVLFPTMIAILFFSTIWWRHQYLYSPMEYRSDESFLTAMQRLQRVEARQEAADLNPRTTGETESLRVVDRLLKLGEVRSAVKVGRIFLEAKQFDAAERIFRAVLKQTPHDHEDMYHALANLGYAQIGLQKFDEAVSNIEKSMQLIGENAGPWHHLALAFAHFKLSKQKGDADYRKFEQHLRDGKNHHWFLGNREFYKNLYPEIASYLS